MQRWIWTCCLGLAALAGTAPGVRAEQPLHRLATAAEARGWEAVGRLDLGSDGFCTAVLISPEIVLTAAHCLFDPGSGAPIDPAIIEFQAGLRLGESDAHRGVKRVMVHPDYGFADAARLDRVGSDLALLQLDRPIRADRVAPFRTQPRVETGQVVQVVSYGWNRALVPSREENCAILARDAAVLVLSCSVDHGSSGAPIFALHRGEVRVVSVVSARARWEGRDVSLAAVMEDQLDTLVGAFARAREREESDGRVEVRAPVDTAATR